MLLLTSEIRESVFHFQEYGNGQRFFGILGANCTSEQPSKICDAGNQDARLLMMYGMHFLLCNS